MLVSYLYVWYSGMYASECKSACGCYSYIWSMRDELREFHLMEKLSQTLNGVRI